MTEKPKLKKKQGLPASDRLDTQEATLRLEKPKNKQLPSHVEELQPQQKVPSEGEQIPPLPQGDRLDQTVKDAAQSERPKQQGFGFGLGKMKELTEAFKKAQRVEEDAKKLQQELETTEIVGGTEDKVLAVFSGSQVPLRVTIAAELMSESAETIAVEVLTAAKDAYTQSRRLMQSKMKEIADSLKISVDALFPDDSE